jgi:hypothetical protein
MLTVLSITVRTPDSRDVSTSVAVSTGEVIDILRENYANDLAESDEEIATFDGMDQDQLIAWLAERGNLEIIVAPHELDLDLAGATHGEAAAVGETVTMYRLEDTKQWDGDGDMVVAVIDGDAEVDKRARDLAVGDVFSEYGMDGWMKVITPDSSETDTVILRVIDVPEPEIADDGE